MTCSVRHMYFISLFVLLALPWRALADDEAAVRYFKEGEEHFQAAQFEKAVKKFRMAVEERASDGTITFREKTKKLVPFGRAFKKEVTYTNRYEEYFPNKRIAEAERKIEELAKPCDLIVSSLFVEDDSAPPNNILDAGEAAELRVQVKNDGEGAGYDTVLNIWSSNSKVDFDREITIGRINPGESKIIRVPLQARFDVTDGKTEFLLNVTEKRKFDSNKVKMKVQTARLDRPKLEVVMTDIADGKAGLAKGNGNHIIESGETIELIVFVKNSGVGPALGVNLAGSGLTDGVNWLSGHHTAFIGTIAPGETAKARLAFEVPVNLDAKNISAHLHVADARPTDRIDKAEYTFAQGYSRRTPELQYDYTIFARGARTESIANGGEFDFELTVKNVGSLKAENVAVNVASDSGVNVSRTRIHIGDVRAQANAQSQRFTISVPRTYRTAEALLSVEIAQADFSSAKSTVKIPVDVKSPELRYTATLRSKSGGASLEQREQAELEVQVINSGKLAAEGVEISLSTRDHDLLVQGKREAAVSVGRIPPGEAADPVKFKVFATTRLKVGEASLGVSITQKEFPSVKQQYALNILEEGFTVIDVTGRGRNRTSMAPASQAGPKIDIIGPETANAAVVEAETYQLALAVADSTDINKIVVLVNGRAVELKDTAGLALKPTKRSQIVQDIPLDEGENKIVIRAYNVANASSRKEFTVTRAVEPDVDTPLHIGRMGNQNGVAVVIGISRFKNKEIPPVAYARNDAATMEKYLRMALRYGTTDHFYDEQADATSLRTYFSKLRTKIKPGKSDLFVFYSGHGTPDTNTLETYFVPYDFDPSSPATTGISANELYKQLGKLGARNVTIVLDSCFSGKASDGQMIHKGLRAGLLKTKDPIFGIKNGLLMAAATSEQPASTYEEKQHGLFTYYFLQGLQGAADSDNNGEITADELSRYVENKVPTMALALHNREQTPEVKGNTSAAVVQYK